MIAVYAGTFDPVTAGHSSVIRQAASLYEHVVVLIAINPSKQTVFTEGERVELLCAVTREHPNVTVGSTTGLVVEHARRIGARVLVRGLRGATDAEFETQLAWANAQLAPEISTVFLPASAELARVSSSGLKERLARGEDLSAYCSPEIEAALRRKLPTAVGAAERSS